MLRPAMTQILKNNESYYSLVVAVAKRARQIAQEAEDNHEILIEKPVKVAVEEFAAGKYRIVENDDIGEKPEQ